MATIAVTVAVYNEQALIEQLLAALLAQTCVPDEIIVVDDGSTDSTAERIQRCAASEPRIRYLHQSNAGPASARNRAWRAATSDICAFTDGDCVPAHDWVERLCAPFAEPSVGATAGTYRTLNEHSALASFVGWEIAWRYRHVGDSVDCHGSYSLAVRREVLEQVSGFDERFRYPSGEDFDLTYRISRKHRIAFVRDAVVGHEHPDVLWPYLRLQARRAFDRVRLYRSHRDKMASDSYTSWTEKYQVLASGLLLATLAAAPIFPLLALASASGLALFVLGTALAPLPWIWQRSPRAAAHGVWIRLVRNYAWGFGVARGLLDLYLQPERAGQQEEPL